MYKLILVFVLMFYATNKLYAYIEELGDFLQIVIPASAYTATFFDDNYNSSLEFYTAFIVDFAIFELLKNTVREKRPDASDYRSFPSGHTAVAFLGASFIYFNYGTFWAVPAYLAASFVAFSRIYSEKHYFHDVLFGAGLGAFTSYIAYKFLGEKTKVYPLVYSYDKTLFYGIVLDW